MLKGIHLTLLAGPLVPVAVPRAVIDSLTGVEVTVSTTGPSAFQLTFSLGKMSILQSIFLLLPTVRVVLIATINGTPEVLIDGVMTNHQVTPDQHGATLVITGEDLTRLMDYQQLSGLPYPAMGTAARVMLILAKYLELGIVPQVVPPNWLDLESPTSNTPLHQGTDLEYIRQLASHVGHVFYIEPGPVPLQNKAYWGPEFKTGVPQPALKINMDAHTNCESLNFHYDSQGRDQPYVTILEPITKLPIPVPIPTNISILNPLLGAIPPVPKSFVEVPDTAKLPLTKALLRGFAAASRTADTVTASGTLDVSRYGQLLKARRLVSVCGGGTGFDGLYYVRRVTHSIQRGSFKQNFELSRSGLVSTIARASA